MVKTLSLFLLFALMALHTPSKAMADYTLESSNIPIIDKMTSSYIGKTLSLRDLDKIVREISQDGLFQVVYIEKLTGNRVIIRAQQSNKLSSVEIEGQSSFSREEILKKMGITIGQIISELEVMQAIEKLENEYKNLGFYNFSITHQKEFTDQGMKLQLSINESDYCIIEDIRFRSKNPRLDQLLEREVSSYIGSNYKKNTSNNIEKRINRVFLRHRFLTSRLTNTAAVFNQDKTKVRITFNIANPTQFEFIFHGNKHFSHFDLVRETHVGNKFLYLTDSSSEINEKIIQLYQDQGFPNVQVVFEEQYFSESQKKIFLFKINEGMRVRNGKVRITGKISKESSYYVKLFKEMLKEQTNSIYYVQRDTELAAENLITFLRREGHLQAEITGYNVDITDKGLANLSIQIDEGILTYVRQVLFRGAKSFSNIELQEQVEIEPNQPLKIDLVEQSFDKLTRFYKEKAFLEFEIQNPNSTVIQYNPGQPYADIVYQINEGDKIRVRDIKISGLKKTKEHVIMRELDFKKGDYLNLSKVTNSTQRLDRSGLFAKTEIRALERKPDEKDSVILIEADERKPGLFSSGIGLLNEGRLTYRGYLGVMYNNLGGKGRAISSRVDLRYQKDVNYLENRLALAYYEPYVFEDRVRGRVSLVREQQLFGFVQNDSDILSTNELRFSLEKEFSQKTRFTYNVWGLSNQETFNVRDRRPRRNFNVGMTGPILEFDHRNDQFLPTSGSYTRFELEFSNPNIGSTLRDPNVQINMDGSTRFADTSEINYYRATFSTTHYTPLTKNRRWVWVNSLRGGYLQNMSDRDGSGVPRVRSFILGGRTLRGFSIGTTETVPGQREMCLKQGIIGQDQQTRDCAFDEIIVRDDSAFFLVKSELRFPIVGNVGGILFYDGGAVYFGEFSLEDPYRDSVGAGIKYDTPVGAFVLQVGYKLDRKLGGLDSFYDRESDFAIQLAIGNF
jgi:outer membrane protein insertion porin family